MLQGDAIEKFHGDKGLALLIANVVNRADIGMIQRRGGLRLALETSQGLRIASYFFGQKLQGDETAQPCVFRFVDDTHAATAKFLYDAIVRDGLADHSETGGPLGRFIL